MSQDLLWRIVKAGSSVHAGYIQGRASTKEGVTTRGGGGDEI